MAERRALVDDEAGASDSDRGEGKLETELLDLEKLFVATGGYDPEGGFVVADLSEGEGDSPKRVRKKRPLFENRIIKLLEIAGVDDLDEETETAVLFYARRHLQIKKRPPPPPRQRKPNKKRLVRKRAVLSSSSSSSEGEGS